MSGAHAHWVGSLDTPNHATKGKNCTKWTGWLITLLIDFQRLNFAKLKILACMLHRGLHLCHN